MRENGIKVANLPHFFLRQWISLEHPSPPSPPELGKLLSDWLIARSIWPIRKQYCSSHFTTESEKTKTFRTTRFLRFMDYPDSFSEWGNIASLKKKKIFQRMFAKTFGFSDSGSPLVEVKLGMLFSFSFPWSLFIVPSAIPARWTWKLLSKWWTD